MSKVSRTTGGALSGAGTGAMIGSVVPGIGTAIGALGGGILGGLGSLFGGSGEDDAQKQIEANKQLYGALQTPEFQQYKPEDYQYAGDYKPEDYNLKTVSEDPNLRNTQLAVLNKMAGLADRGMSDVDQQGYERARELGDQMSHSGTEAALQNASARGGAGSGMEFAMREMAGQGGANRALDAGLQQSGDSARMRAMYEQMMGQQAAGLRGQDFGVNSANTDIQNRMNQLNTQGANTAQQVNLGNRQQIGNMNTSGHNQAQQYNNSLQQQRFQDQLSKTNGQAGANTAAYGNDMAQSAANQNTMNGVMQAGGQYAISQAGKQAAPKSAPVDGVSTSSNEYDPRKDWSMAQA